MYFEAESEGASFQVTVNETKTHWKVGTRRAEQDWEFYEISKDDYRYLDDTVSFIFNNRSYLVDVIPKGTEYTVYTRGVFKTFRVFNEEAILHESLKAGGGFGGGANLASGMPGKIVKIFVKPGDQVKTGEPLLIMEAMKMENEMRAGADVTIKDVLVQEGVNVESGATLITYEE